jgi:hypothetical protein
MSSPIPRPLEMHIYSPYFAHLIVPPSWPPAGVLRREASIPSPLGRGLLKENAGEAGGAHFFI